MPDHRVRQLRVDATDAERRLWGALRDRRLGSFKFRRQHRLGRFIVDFIYFECRLIIEADGGQHADNPYDETRTAWLEQQGWRVVRFWNSDILTNIEGHPRDDLGGTAKPSPSRYRGPLPLSPASGRGAKNDLTKL